MVESGYHYCHRYPKPRVAPHSTLNRLALVHVPIARILATATVGVAAPSLKPAAPLPADRDAVMVHVFAVPSTQDALVRNQRAIMSTMPQPSTANPHGPLRFAIERGPGAITTEVMHRIPPAPT